MNPPPPMLPASGHVTASANATATAASTALPPFFRMATPTSAAGGETHTTMPPVDWARSAAGCWAETKRLTRHRAVTVRRRMWKLRIAACGVAAPATPQAAGGGSPRAQGAGVGDPEVVVNLSGRVGAVERVKVDAADVVVQQVGALLGRPVDADPGDRRIVPTPLDQPQQFRRVAGSCRHLGHRHHALFRRHRHDAGHDGHLDPGQLAPLAEVVEVAVLEEQLRADVISPGVHLCLEVIHLLEPIRAARVPLREAGDADAEP